MENAGDAGVGLGGGNALIEVCGVYFEIDAVPILIPARHGDLEGLIAACERLTTAGRPFLADPILDPIHFGFTDSIVRYHELRRRLPRR